MTLTTKTLSTSLILVAGFASLSSPVFAAERTATVMESVPFTQQELTTTQGVAAVHKRVVSAAYDICVGSDSRDRLFLPKTVVKKCVVDITESALSSDKYAILASYNASLKSPTAQQSRLAKTEWSVEKFEMAQMPGLTTVNVLP